ncbi:two-component system LytT family response regulator [Runella defluvii]|uniref:Two-component system LytT family response regulator n=1 Tax=Runella defluvii TaxID=370973 RepID=A0A7W5ZK57_9BACT|nr:LytTR family DNA-binding domain-containing protein [Runella defluvii]MBB3838640.1 two-component system LytT family response regulator [Runella defluvii]
MNTQPLLTSFPTSSGTHSNNSIIIPNGTRQIVIPMSQLVCMEGSGNYAYIYTSDGRRYLVSKTLKSYADILDKTVFLRVHKSWIINLAFLQDYCEDDRSLRLQGGREIAISRRRIREVCPVLRRAA